MFHIAGIFGRGYFAIAHGMSIVIPSPIGARDKRFIENYWKFVDKFGITIFSGVPTTLAQLAKSGPQRRAARNPARIRLHRLDRLPGRGGAADRERDRRARAARPTAPPNTPRMSRRRRATAIRNSARPASACPYTQVKTVELDDDVRSSASAASTRSVSSSSRVQASRRATSSRNTTRASSPATAGSIPATSAVSMPTAISGSPAASRT